MPMVKRFFMAPEGSSFVFGPRGTGKSTWLRQHCPDALWVDLLDSETRRLFAAHPERLRAAVLASPNRKQVVIDEIQKVPALLDVVHQVMEECPDRRFLLTGSSARKLKRAGVDLLAGRAMNLSLHPFMAAELGTAFDLSSALDLGLLPVVVSARNPERALAAYVGLYLEQEVQAEALVRDVGGFSRFLEAIAFSHGRLLNTSAVARECQVSRSIVEGYLAIVEDLLLAFRLPVFSRRAKRLLTQHPKFYYFDAGVFRSVRPAGPLDTPGEIGGPALEGLVAQHLRAWIAYGNERCRLFYWRTKSGSEVDFVVYGPGTFFAVEVKNARAAYRRDVRALRSFREDYGAVEVCLLYRGRERLLVDDVLCLPVDEFLRGLHPKRALSLREQTSP